MHSDKILILKVEDGKEFKRSAEFKNKYIFINGSDEDVETFSHLLKRVLTGDYDNEEDIIVPPTVEEELEKNIVTLDVQDSFKEKTLLVVRKPNGEFEFIYSDNGGTPFDANHIPIASVSLDRVINNLGELEPDFKRLMSDKKVKDSFRLLVLSNLDYLIILDECSANLLPSSFINNIIAAKDILNRALIKEVTDDNKFYKQTFLNRIVCIKNSKVSSSLKAFGEPAITSRLVQEILVENL